MTDNTSGRERRLAGAFVTACVAGAICAVDAFVFGSMLGWACLTGCAAIATATLWMGRSA